MKNLDLLPEDLKSKSLSDKEIVLQLEDALKAIDILMSKNYAFAGWEGWAKYPNGNVGHIFPYQGTVSLDKKPNDDWNSYISWSSEVMKKTMNQSFSEWLKDPRSKDHTLYFCISSSTK